MVTPQCLCSARQQLRTTATCTDLGNGTGHSHLATETTMCHVKAPDIMHAHTYAFAIAQDVTVDSTAVPLWGSKS